VKRSRQPFRDKPQTFIPILSAFAPIPIPDIHAVRTIVDMSHQLDEVWPVFWRRKRSFSRLQSDVETEEMRANQSRKAQISTTKSPSGSWLGSQQTLSAYTI